MNILVGIDYEPHSELALVAALEAFRSFAGTRLLVVHVTPASSFDDDARLIECQSRLEEYVRAHLPGARPEQSSSGRELYLQVVGGSPADELLACARELEADHIFVGTHGRTGLQRWVMGSVAERVVREAGCPVHVVRHRDWGIPQIEPAAPNKPGPEVNARPPKRRWHYVPRNVAARVNHPLTVPQR